MSLINVIEPAEASGEIADIYRQAEAMMGHVPASLKINSLNPILLRQQWEYMGSVMQHPSLPSELFTCIRLLVSLDQRCDYCIYLNEVMLVQMHEWTVDAVSAVKNNPAKAPFDEKEKALLLFALKAVAISNDVSQQDVDELRKLGCSDLEIYDVVAHGARQSAGDIILNTFKVERD